MLKIAQEDGTFLKISRRKKRKSTGRKRGRPKKQVEKPKLPKSRKKPYSIILASRGKQKQTLKVFGDQNEAYQYLSKLQEDNRKVMFPVKYLNLDKSLEEAKYELYIVKHISENDTKETTYLRNDYGELVEYETNSEKWQIIDKCEWDIEETFWVYGFDPIFQRKDFNWIMDNMISNQSDYYTFKNILVYKNKLIIDSDGNLDIVFCKNISDSFRLYTLLETICLKRRYRRIMFSGDITLFSKATIGKWIDRLCETTGFNRKKIMRKSLKP